MNRHDINLMLNKHINALEKRIDRNERIIKSSAIEEIKESIEMLINQKVCKRLKEILEEAEKSCRLEHEKEWQNAILKFENKFIASQISEACDGLLSDKKELLKNLKNVCENLTKEIENEKQD